MPVWDSLQGAAMQAPAMLMVVSAIVTLDANSRETAVVMYLQLWHAHNKKASMLCYENPDII